MIGILTVLVLGFAGGAVAHSLFASKFASEVAAVKAECGECRTSLLASGSK